MGTRAYCELSGNHVVRLPPTGAHASRQRSIVRLQLYIPPPAAAPILTVGRNNTNSSSRSAILTAAAGAILTAAAAAILTAEAAGAILTAAAGAILTAAAAAQY